MWQSERQGNREKVSRGQPSDLCYNIRGRDRKDIRKIISQNDFAVLVLEHSTNTENGQVLASLVQVLMVCQEKTVIKHAQTQPRNLPRSYLLYL